MSSTKPADRDADALAWSDWTQGNDRSRASQLVFFGDSLTDNGNLFRLEGIPPPPYWQGRSSNGPTYAEQLPALVGVRAGHVQNYAYAGATSAGTSAIDLDAQVQAFAAALGGRPAPRGTEVVLDIGSNDYLNYAANPGSTTPQQLVADVIGHIQSAVTTLAQDGVHKFVFFTLANFSITPLGQTWDAMTKANADALAAADNAALEAAAQHDKAAGLDVIVVDINALSKALAVDASAFGFQDTAAPLIGPDGKYLSITGPDGQQHLVRDLFAPNEIAFADAIHPTYAGHGVQAAFAAATLNADPGDVQVSTTGHQAKSASGNAFIFDVVGGNSISIGPGNAVVYAGDGGSTVTAHGWGTDLFFAGGSGNTFTAGDGVALLATNATSGLNTFHGGRGEDIVVVNRAGDNTITTGSGETLVIFKENAVNGATFGAETIGGNGHGDTILRFVINDQNPLAEQGLITEFKGLAAAFTASEHSKNPGTFSFDGIAAQHVDGIQLEIDSVDAAQPYLIDATVAQSVGAGIHLDGAAQALLQQARLWGLLTV